MASDRLTDDCAPGRPRDRRGTRELPAMTTDRDVAQLCLAIYSGAGEWDQVELPDDGIAFGVKDLGPITALIFRGSTT